MCSSHHLGSISPSQLLLRIIANRQSYFSKKNDAGQKKQEAKEKKKNHSYLGHRDALSVCAAVCLSKAMSSTRFKKKKGSRRAEGAERDVKGVFHACQVGSRLKRTEECCVL